MDRAARGHRSPDSDTDGSEDIFLDLAHSDDDFQDPPSRQAHRRNEEEEDDNAEPTLRNLPGQFPDRVPQSKEDNRPRSSSYLSYATGEAREPIARAQHTRHVSTPNGDSAYSNNFSSFRQNRQIGSHNTDFSSARYQPVTPSYSQVETPRLRRQRRLYAEADGNADEKTQYMNAYRSSRRPSLASPMQPSPTSAMNQTIPNDSDSVGSQKTAASTVWDELDDLKSRIKRLETTGRLPSTANGAIANHTSARPQTATTAPTTVSSSPKQVRKQVATSSEKVVGGSVPADVHPTLQSALARAKSTLKPHVYRPLEASIMDSLAMAVATGKQNLSAVGSTAASTVNGFGIADRQTRRKVDSLCRNLADLCIAMCDNRNDEVQALSSPTSAQKPKPSSPRRYVRQSIEPGESVPDMPVSLHSRRGSRASWARPDDHRSSRLSISGRHDLPDDMQGADRSPSTTPKDYTARYSGLGRNETALHDRRQPIAETAEESSIRAPSRAMTDIGRLGFGPKREHLRTGAARSPSLRETLEARRRSANLQGDDDITDTSSSVGITGQTPAARRFLERVRGTPSEVGSSVSSARPRMGSEDFKTPSPRFSTPAARNNSLNQRRFAT